MIDGTFYGWAEGTDMHFPSIIIKGNCMSVFISAIKCTAWMPHQSLSLVVSILLWSFCTFFVLKGVLFQKKTCRDYIGISNRRIYISIFENIPQTVVNLVLGLPMKFSIHKNLQCGSREILHLLQSISEPAIRQEAFACVASLSPPSPITRDGAHHKGT